MNKLMNTVAAAAMLLGTATMARAAENVEVLH